MKNFVWIAVIVAIVGGLAYPKVKPLLMADGAGAGTAAGEHKEGSGKSDKTGKKEGEGKGGAQGNGENGGKGKKDAKPLPVSTFIVKPTEFSETITATGSVRADEGVELLPETNGKIVDIKFEEGTHVKKGALLVKLNDADLRANLERYTYTKQLAVLREQRQSKLLDQRVVKQDDYDSALNDVQVQQSLIDLYKAQIEKTEIRAPFDGVVGLRYVSTGAYVNANTTKIATLQRIEKLKIDFSVPEKYSGRIKAGDNITFSVAGGIKKFAGRIYAIDPRIDSGTRTLLIRALCPNTDGTVLPGAFANITMSLEKIPDALLVPAEAVIPGLDEKNVFVMKDGVAERRAVETGSRTAVEVHITAGLKAGDVVITSGLQQMRAGQAVMSLDARRNKEGGTKDSKEEGGKTQHAEGVQKKGDHHSPPTAAVALIHSLAAA